MPDSWPEDLHARTFRFTCEIFDFCEELACQPGMARRVAYQLFDAGSSVGANRAESKAAYSRRDFAAKNALCLKESREAHFWLQLADAKMLGDKARRTRLLREADELVAIFTASVRRLQTEPAERRGPRT